MPNLISQMRNGISNQQPQAQQPQLNNSIQQVRGMMSEMRKSANPQDYLMRLLGQNPELINAMRSGNLKTIAEQMARERDIDLNNLIRQLSANF